MDRTRKRGTTPVPVTFVLAAALVAFETTEGWNQDQKGFGVIATFKGA